ncbi:MAG: PDZ domain-containing protein, partial [Hymenobacteraceae bacterium]|nr:PDZ domain-containing protein [Hymenobacteraceae bacterium]
FSTYLVLTATILQAQQRVEYSLSFPNAVHHEAEISVTFFDVQSDTLQVLMPRSSPGRYALHEFAKNVYQVNATNEKGEKLKLLRPSLHQWKVVGPSKQVTFTYTLFGDRADGTYTGIDRTHAHLNMPATLVYARGFEKAPVVVKFNIPQHPEWQVATQLKQEQSKNTFTAPNLQYLMDSPTELADFMMREWQVQTYAHPDTVLRDSDVGIPDRSSKEQKIVLALHHTGTAAEADAYAESAKKIVEEARAVFGELPDFEFGKYTFIACYMPHADGDGMEHRNSTILTSPLPLSSSATRNLSTLSHEFFHAWNVERIRPKALEPFNFQDANNSRELWFAEGFTSYYGDLLMRRSGALSDKEYANGLAGDLNYVLLSPGSRFFSPVEMSFQAPFVDAAKSVDPVNRTNTFISYYPYGSVVGLALDLELRRRNLNLDDYMKQVWQQHGKPEKPYTNQDLKNILAAYSADSAFANAFFRDYIYGQSFAHYEELLKQAGFILRRKNAGKASLGYAPLQFADKKATVTAGTRIGSPLYEAGIDREDELLTLGGKKLRKGKDLEKILEKHKPGDKLLLEYSQRGKNQQTEITLVEDPELEVVLQENTGVPLRPEQQQFRQNWLGAKRNR